MKRFYALLTALLLLGFTLPSQAAWNIRQKGTGGAVWIDQNSVEVPVGNAGIAVQITHIGLSATYFVTVNKPGKLRRIYAVGGPFVSGSSGPQLSFQIAAAATNKYIAISNGLGATLTMSTAAGVPVTLTPSDLKIDVVQGGTIAIFNAGGLPQNSSPATVTIVIE